MFSTSFDISMALVVKRPKLSRAERLYLPAILGGLSITLKHLRKLISGKTKVTMQYPRRAGTHICPIVSRRTDTRDGRTRPRALRGLPALRIHLSAARHHDQPEEIPPARSLGQGREATRGVRNRHDPLHLLRHVRGSLPRAGHLPAEGLLHHGLPARRWFTTRRSSTRWAACWRGSCISGTKRSSPFWRALLKPSSLSLPYALALFWVFAALMLIFGAAVVFRNPVSSALSLVMSFVCLAALFVRLDAFFIGVVQVLVYAGAVMVLFLFIIMLLDLRSERPRRVNIGAWIGGALVVFGFVGLLGKVLSSNLAFGWEKPAISNPQDKRRLRGRRSAVPAFQSAVPNRRSAHPRSDHWRRHSKREGAEMTPTLNHYLAVSGLLFLSDSRACCCGETSSSSSCAWN